MDEKRIQCALPHNLILEDRRKLTVSCVNEVDSFDDQSVVAITSLGELTIDGENLHIIRFNTDEGELAVEGNISSVSYSENIQTSGGFFSRIFR